MKYFIRAIKYFVYIAIIFVLIISIMVLLKFVDPNPEALFKHGTQSIWQIAAILGVFSLMYPKFGFTKRNALILGSTEEIQPGVVEYMENRGYRLERKEGDEMSFRLSSPLYRITRMLEDRITMTRTINGYELEGPTKDLVRIVSGLEAKFHQEETGE